MPEWINNIRIGHVSKRTEKLVEAFEKVSTGMDMYLEQYEQRMERTRKRIAKEKRNLG